MEFIFIVTILVFLSTFVYAGYKGAPWVPTREKNLPTIIKALDLKPNSIFYDIGCGDGRLVFAAAETGATAIGLEVSLLPYLLAQIRRLKSPARKRIRILYKNLWRTDLSSATHLYFFLMPEMFPKLTEKIKKEIKPGSIVASYVWPLPSLTPTNVIKEKEQPAIYLYTL